MTDLPGELPENEVALDLEDGGRWTSLRMAGREWLWQGPGLVSGSRWSVESALVAVRR